VIGGLFRDEHVSAGFSSMRRCRLAMRPGVHTGTPSPDVNLRGNPNADHLDGPVIIDGVLYPTSAHIATLRERCMLCSAPDERYRLSSADGTSKVTGWLVW
jgi:hypothetical protein